MDISVKFMHIYHRINYVLITLYTYFLEEMLEKKQNR